MSSSNASIGRSAGKLRYGEVRGEDGAPAHSHQQVRTLAYGIEMARGFHKPREYPQLFQVRRITQRFPSLCIGIRSDRKGPCFRSFLGKRAWAILIAYHTKLNVAFGSSLFSNSGIDVKLSVVCLPGSLFSPR